MHALETLASADLAVVGGQAAAGVERDEGAAGSLGSLAADGDGEGRATVVVESARGGGAGLDGGDGAHDRPFLDSGILCLIFQRIGTGIVTDKPAKARLRCAGEFLYPLFITGSARRHPLSKGIHGI
ncbi:hypothetical protein SDC9_93092 [bioreactor metagenome]|uniref:Uncharacterized protein n=1 Tax=bioreactor metagenome TaxID=1076179 RepID=A0A645A039_9ZZZZ